MAEARYHLLPRGVFDRELGRAIAPGGPEWPDYQAWVAKANLPDAQPIEVAIEAQRRELDARINLRRTKAMAAGVTFEGHIYQSDPTSRAAVVRWANAPTLPEGFAWRDIANVDVLMDGSDLQRLAQAMLAHERQCFTNALLLKTMIRNADDPASVDIDAGWPGS